MSISFTLKNCHSKRISDTFVWSLPFHSIRSPCTYLKKKYHRQHIQSKVSAFECAVWKALVFYSFYPVYKYRKSSSSIANPRFRARLHAGVLIESFVYIVKPLVMFPIGQGSQQVIECTNSLPFSSRIRSWCCEDSAWWRGLIKTNDYPIMDLFWYICCGIHIEREKRITRQIRFFRMSLSCLIVTWLNGLSGITDSLIQRFLCSVYDRIALRCKLYKKKQHYNWVIRTNYRYTKMSPSKNIG